MNESRSRATLRSRIILPFVSVLLGLLVAVFAGEVVLRLVAPPWLAWRMTLLNPPTENVAVGSDRDWPIQLENGSFRQFNPNSRFKVVHYEYDHWVEIDELGGRVVPSGNRDKPLVLVLGDSFAFGVGVDDADVFVNLIAEDVPGRVVNLSWPGSSLPDHIGVIDRRFEELQNPEIVIFAVFMGNDISDILQVREDGDEAPAEAGGRLLWKINSISYHNVLLKRSYFVQFFRGLVLRFVRASGEKVGETIFRLMNRDDEYLKNAGRQYVKEASRLAEMQDGWKAALVIIPDRYQLDETDRTLAASYYDLDAARLDPDRPNDYLMKELSALGLKVIDTTSCMRESYQDDFYYVQDNHLTKDGHIALSQCLRSGGLVVFMGGS